MERLNIPPEENMDKGPDRSSLLKRLKRTLHIGIASLGMLSATAEAKDISHEDVSYREKEMGTVGTFDISTYSYEALPADEASISAKYEFTDKEKQRLTDLRKVTKHEREYSLRNSWSLKMTPEEINKKFDALENALDQVEKDRAALEAQMFQSSDDPRIIPIIKKVEEIMGIKEEDIGNKKFVIEIKDIDKDTMPNMNGNAWTKQDGTISISSRYVEALMNPTDADHAAALVKIAHEIAHSLRHKQYGVENGADQYTAVYDKAAKEGLRPKGYIGEEKISEEARKIYQEWLADKRTYGLDKNDPDAKGEYMEEIEAFAVSNLVGQDVKKNGLHYKIPKNIPFDPNIKLKK